MQPDPIQSLLPWGLPFRMIDRLVECAPHQWIVTWKRVTSGDAMAQDPRREGAALPAVMVLEGMGQSASLLHQLSYGKILGGQAPLLGFLKAKHVASARAGDAIEFTVRAVKMTSTMGLFEGVARVAGSPIAQAEFALGMASGETEEDPSAIEGPSAGGEGSSDGSGLPDPGDSPRDSPGDCQ